MRGKFIVIDGIGASGKDTQVELLEKYLKNKKIDVLVTREHTRDTPTGILIEKIIKKQEDQIEGQALQLLFVSDRRNHFVKVIKPALEEGKTVIGNRYYPVNVAFSTPDWREKFLKINQMVVDKPDLVLIIDVPAEMALERMAKRGDHDIFDKLEIMERNRQGYEWYMENSGDKCVLIDGNKSIEEVHQNIINNLESRKLL
ncbi:MAG: dTMP kinase [Candidatus Shapirobacteria bacterium]|nr:dTMP kinase [Candidatus Shapirobacteria bacterium]